MFLILCGWHDKHPIVKELNIPKHNQSNFLHVKCHILAHILCGTQRKKTCSAKKKKVIGFVLFHVFITN